MLYSPHPHEYYLDENGRGPGHKYLGDLERWNWRWLMIGTRLDDSYDFVMKLLEFSDSKRECMRKPPLEAMDFITDLYHLTPECARSKDHFNLEEITRRAEEAQYRLFGELVESIGDNILKVNFAARRR